MGSPLILSISTVFALMGIVLVAIAFGTNNWQEFKVDRKMLETPDSGIRPTDLGSKKIFYSRSYGLFKECFMGDEPNSADIQAQTSVGITGTSCMPVMDYQIPENKTITNTFSSNQWIHMHLIRSLVAFYIVGLALLFLCLFTGLCGCWRRSANLILTTGVFLLFSTLFLAAAMAVWHGIDYLAREVISANNFFLTWPEALKNNTKIDYGWSYMVSWVGIGFTLIASVLMLYAYRAMKAEEDDEYDKKRAPYMVANYYDKQALMPYSYPQSAYAYPAAAAYGYGQYGGYAPYGYMSYGR